MIVGQDILSRHLISGGSADNLKHSTYDLTIGEIIKIGKKVVKRRQKDGPLTVHYIEPREMIWVLSKEDFKMPADVTGIATLRTSYTKQGLLALNVGIIDPLFEGPISTALINFSDKPRRIYVGDKFFRVAFFSHDDVSAFHKKSESRKRAEYTEELESVSYTDFVPSFLNIPNLDDDYYFRRFWKMIGRAAWEYKIVSGLTLLFIGMVLWYLFEETRFWDFLTKKWSFIGNIYRAIKWW